MKPVFGINREKHNKLFYMEYKNDWGTFQFHSPIELYFIDDGEMEITVNHTRKILSAGQMSVALSYDAHAYKTPEYSRSSLFIIPTYMCKDFLEVLKDKQVTDPFILDRNTVAKIKEYVLETQKENINPITLSGFIHVILGTVMDNISFQKVHKPTDTDLASNLLFYINENYKEDISLKTVAQHFGFAASYISRYFKESFNIGFNKYVNILRLKNALLLMKENKNSITYCAMESGFNSLRTFYRAFYEEFGCTPKQYMK